MILNNKNLHHDMSKARNILYGGYDQYINILKILKLNLLLILKGKILQIKRNK